MSASRERPGLGGALTNAWLITVGVVILLTGAGYDLRCRARRRGTGLPDCPGPTCIASGRLPRP